MMARLGPCFGLAFAAFLIGSCAAKRGPEIVGREYETKISGEGVVESNTEDDAGGVQGSPSEEGSVDQAGEVASAPPAFVPEDRLRVLEVMRAGDEAGTRIVVQLSRAPESWDTMELSGPRRCVIDVQGPTATRAGPPTIETDDSLAPRMRLGRSPDRLRVVVEPSASAPQGCDASVKESAVVIGLGGQPTGASAATVWEDPDKPAGAGAHAAYVLASASGTSVPRAPGASAGAPLPPPLPAEEPAALAKSRPSAPLDADEPLAAPPASPEAAAPPPPPPQAPPAAPGVRALDPRAAQLDDLETPSRRIYSGRRISLEFKDADILNVLRIIADVSHRNIVATDDVTGTVTLVLYDVPWDQALDILLKSTGLEMVEYDDVITISTSKRLEEERKARLAAHQAGRQLEPLQTLYLKVNYVKAQDLARLLRGGAAGAVQAFQNQQATAGEDIGTTRRGLLSERGSVMVNEATNTLIVRDIADGIANAREMVGRLDVQTPQVAIQGLIFEADTDMARDLGIRWGARYIASPETGNPTGKNFPGRVAIGGGGPGEQTGGDGDGGDGDGDGGDGAGAALPLLVDFPAKGVAAGAGSTLGLLLGSLDGSTTIDAQITAIENAGKGKVISRPKVITLNNSEAQIQSLEILRVRLPSTGTVINTGAGGSAGGQTVATQAIDTGIILRVTPQVSSDGYILLQMFVKSSVPSTATTDDIPNEISRQATSQVLVRDGETVVIGGVYRQQANFAEGGVPWLRSVPVFGWFFKNQSTEDRRQELLVFITPRVVWRTIDPRKLPTATDLWQDRDRGAYEILSPDQAEEDPSPLSAIPG